MTMLVRYRGSSLSAEDGTAVADPPPRLLRHRWPVEASTRGGRVRACARPLGAPASTCPARRHRAGDRGLHHDARGRPPRPQAGRRRCARTAGASRGGPEGGRAVAFGRRELQLVALEHRDGAADEGTKHVGRQELEPLPRPGIHADLTALAALAAAHEDRAAAAIKVTFGERERLTDPQPRPPQHDHQRAHPQPLRTRACAAHHADDLLDARRISGIAQPLVSRRAPHAVARQRRRRTSTANSIQHSSSFNTNWSGDIVLITRAAAQAR